MAIDLPPALPPQLVDSAEVQASAQAGTNGSYKRFQLYLDQQPACLDQDTLSQATDAAATLSDVVLQIARLCYAEGYPTSQIVYARMDDTVFISARDRVIARVDLPAAYQGYFEGLVGKIGTDNAFERRRALAGVKADRSGEDVQLTYTQAADQSVTLTTDRSQDKAAGSVTPQFGNLGNRFVGRYIAGLDVSQGFRRGWSVNASGRAALSGLNDDNGQRADRYNEQQIQVSNVTPWGVFGVTGRAVQFDDVDNAAVPFDANIEQGSLSWAGVLRSTFSDRLSATAEVERINRETDLVPSGQRAFRELYTAIGAGARFEKNFGIGIGTLRTDAGIAASTGLGDDDNALTAADLGYVLARPTLGLSLTTVANLEVNLDLAAQVSDDVVPEQKQWVLGGTETVHAFLPGVAAGDKGYLARLEVGTQEFKFGQFGQFGVSGRVFAENAQADSNRPMFDDVNLLDAGVAFNARWRNHVSALLAYAHPLDDDDLTDAQRASSDANVLFALSVEAGWW